jgi:hypothetical protein
MRLPASGVLEFGAKVTVFKYHQYRPAAREGFKLIKQCLEQLPTFALGAQIKISGGIGNDSSSPNNSISYPRAHSWPASFIASKWVAAICDTSMASRWLFGSSAFRLSPRQQ